MMTDKSRKIFDPREVGAVMKALTPFLSTYAKPMEAAMAVLEAVYAKPRDHKFNIARKCDRTIIVMVHQDKGDVVPGFDEHMNRFEAFTSYFEWGKTHEDRAYVQVDKFEAEKFGDIAAYRHIQDMQHLEQLGFDTSTIVEITDA